MVTTIFDANGVYIPSTKSRAIRVKAWAAGGGGAGASDIDDRAISGGGGGGGGCTLGYIDVRRVSSIPVIVGQGGPGGLIGADGQDGTDTIIEGPSHLIVPGAKGGKALRGPGGLQGGQGSVSVAKPGLRLFPGGPGGTWPNSLLYSFGGGGGAAGKPPLAALGGGAPDGGFHPGEGDTSGDGGAGAVPTIPSFRLIASDAQPGFVPGGGGGGGCALTPQALTCAGFTGSATRGTLSGSVYNFFVEIMADWHDLVTVAHPELELGLSIAIVSDTFTPWPESETTVFELEIAIGTPAIFAIGYIEQFQHETVSGHVYAFDDFGGRSNDAAWSFTMTG